MTKEDIKAKLTELEIAFEDDLTKAELEALLPEEEEAVEEEEETEVIAEFPEVAGTGKFQAVKVGDGMAVYNPDGTRVSEVLPNDDANDIVREQNLAL